MSSIGQRTPQDSRAPTVETKGMATTFMSMHDETRALEPKGMELVGTKAEAKATMALAPGSKIAAGWMTLMLAGIMALASRLMAAETQALRGEIMSFITTAAASKTMVDIMKVRMVMLMNIAGQIMPKPRWGPLWGSQASMTGCMSNSIQLRRRSALLV